MDCQGKRGCHGGGQKYIAGKVKAPGIAVHHGAVHKGDVAFMKPVKAVVSGRRAVLAELYCQMGAIEHSGSASYDSILPQVQLIWEITGRQR